MYYRGAGPWGPGKGSNLIAAEFDSNTYQLVQLIEAKAAQGVGILTMTVTGNELWVTLTDSTLLGPYVLPVVSISFVGAWLPATQYYANQIFTANGATYIVNENHVSASSFDAGANDGLGNDYYGLLLSNAANALPTGGAVGMVMQKATTADFSALWAWPTLAGLHDVLPSPAPLSGQILYWNGGSFGYLPQSSVNAAPQLLANLDDVLQSPAPLDGDAVVWSASANAFTFGGGGGSGGALADLDDVNIGGMVEGDVLTFNASNGLWENDQPVGGGEIFQKWTTSTKTLALSDNDNWIDARGGSQTLTIPEAGTVAFPTGSTFWLNQYEQVPIPVTFVPDTFVTFTPPLGRLAQPRAQGSLIKITYAGSDEWLFDGDLAYDPTINLGLNGSSTLTQHFTPQLYNTELYPVTVSQNQNYVADSAPAGQRMTFVITTAGTTSCTITFSTGFKAQGTLATGTSSGKIFTVSFIGDGSNMCETSRTTAM